MHSEWRYITSNAILLPTMAVDHGLNIEVNVQIPGLLYIHVDPLLDITMKPIAMYKTSSYIKCIVCVSTQWKGVKVVKEKNRMNAH